MPALRRVLVFVFTISLFSLVQASDVVSVKQLAELTASGGSSGDGFGQSVAMSGNTIVVGASDHNSRMGAAYVFVEPKSGWTNATQTATLTASDGQFGDFFGTSVAIDGDTVVVGAPAASTNGIQGGAVYVFVKPPNGWQDMTQTAKLSPSNGATVGDLGEGVAISGNVIAAGAPTGGSGNPGPGAAYLFVQPNGGWVDMTQTAILTASNGMNDDEFGFCVAISGDTVAVGAPEAPYANGPGPGTAYVFVEPAQGWVNMTQTGELRSSNGVSNDNLGASVSIYDNTIAAGSPLANSRQGAIYVFVKPASGWGNQIQAAELEPAAGELGASVSIINNGSTIVAGAINQNNAKGAVFVFLEPSRGWITTSKYNLEVRANNSRDGNYFGASVGVNGHTGVVGAPSAPFSTQNGPGPGAAYVFGP